MIRICILSLFLALAGSSAWAENFKLAVTTSFENSGLADVLLPQIKADLGIDVQMLVVGTGQAIRLGEAGDVDAILVHARAAEEAFVASGFGTHRREIMYNDFVLIGPVSDPAGIADATGVTQAMTHILAAQPPFVSRGDDSGTHKAEVALWANANADPATFGPWYRAVGAGMGAALNTAAGLDAYILADRASWLNFGNKSGLKLLFSGDPALFNQYTYIAVNPSNQPHVRHDLAERLEAWLVSDTARALINGFQINGEALFVFNAKSQ
jgi:tungstate transport system substrate-binding protein